MTTVDLTSFAYDDLKMLSEALCQYIDNDAEVQADREERGEAEPEAIDRARQMMDAVDARMLVVLGVA